MSVEEFVTLKEAASIAGLSRSAIVEWIGRGLLDQYTILNSVCVKREQLNRLLAYRKQHPDIWKRTWKSVKGVEEE